MFYIEDNVHTSLKLPYDDFLWIAYFSSSWFHSDISLKIRNKGIYASRGGEWETRGLGVGVGFAQRLLQATGNLQLPWGSLSNRKINRKKNLWCKIYRIIVTVHEQSICRSEFGCGLPDKTLIACWFKLCRLITSSFWNA